MVSFTSPHPCCLHRCTFIIINIMYIQDYVYFYLENNYLILIYCCIFKVRQDKRDYKMKMMSCYSLPYSKVSLKRALKMMKYVHSLI